MQLNDIHITYMPTVTLDNNSPIKRFQIIRKEMDNKELLSATNYFLNNISDNGKYINYDDSEYQKWLMEAIKTIDLYYSPNNKLSLYNFTTNINIFTYKDFKEHNLDKHFSNLLLTTGNIQKRYIVQYCQFEDNKHIRMIAKDLLYNNNKVKIENQKLLKYMLKGKIDLIEEIMQ